MWPTCPLVGIKQRFIFGSFTGKTNSFWCWSPSLVQPECGPKSSFQRGLAHIGAIKCTLLPPEDKDYGLIFLPTKRRKSEITLRCPWQISAPKFCFSGRVTIFQLKIQRTLAQRCLIMCCACSHIERAWDQELDWHCPDPFWTIVPLSVWQG